MPRVQCNISLKMASIHSFERSTKEEGGEGAWLQPVFGPLQHFGQDATEYIFIPLPHPPLTIIIIIFLIISWYMDTVTYYTSDVIIKGIIFRKLFLMFMTTWYQTTKFSHGSSNDICLLLRVFSQILFILLYPIECLPPCASASVGTHKYLLTFRVILGRILVVTMPPCVPST